MAEHISGNFNEEAQPVGGGEMENFLAELKAGKCAVLVRFENNTVREDVMPSVKKTLDVHGGHVVSESFSPYGKSTYVWTGAEAIRELEKLPGARLVQPYRNWPHENEAPKMKFHRG